MTEHDTTIGEHVSDSEVYRRFPEVDCIGDDTIREKTIDAIARGVPEYFWNVPATGSGRYHNPFARDKYGLWIHVKMVFAAYERFVDSFVQMGLIDEAEADMGRSAVLLHDMLKYGTEYSDGDGTASNHDNLAGVWLEQHTELPQPVIRCVKCHNGDWYDGPTPEYRTEPLAILVHMADMAASTSDGTWGVYEPADEITQRYPNLPQANL